MGPRRMKISVLLWRGLVILGPVMSAWNLWYWTKNTVHTSGTLILMVLYAFLSLKRQILPSGLVVSPSAVLPIFTIIVLPLPLSMLVPLPSIALCSNFRRRGRTRVLEAAGQMVAAQLAAGGMYHWVAPEKFALPESLPASMVLIAAYEVANRVLSAFVNHCRTGESISGKLGAYWSEQNWGALGINLLAVLMASDFLEGRYWESVFSKVILLAVWESVSYFAAARFFDKALMEDTLTGVGSRKAWEIYEKRLLSGLEPHPDWVGYVDMDGLKTLNDTYGHETGDRALRELGQTLLAACGSGAKVCRLGGDEFILAYSHEAAEQISKHLESFSRRWSQKGFLVSASLGSVLVDDSVKEAVGQAEKLMYLVKQSRKGLDFF